MLMTVQITYFVHGTTVDNEHHKASGWSDAKLSELGVQQSKELWNKIKDKKFDVVFCSDLSRAVDSANFAFKGKVKIIKDKRLREVDYGDLTQQDSKKVDSIMLSKINESFPNGESYMDVEERMRSFLKDLTKYNGKQVAIVAHRAPQLALNVILKGKTWEQAIREDWRHKKAWKPGWDYMHNF